MRVRHLLFFTLLVAFCSSGCIFGPEDDPGTEPPPPVECTTATSADHAMEVFQEVYAGRELDCYRELLSEDYLFIDQEGGYDNYDEEMRIANKMFNGLEGENNFIISDITIDRLEPQGVWTDTPENDPNFGGFPESQYRNYLVDFKFHISGQNLILRVQGPVLYYVMDEGGDEPDFKILGMVDATYGQ